MKRAPSEQSAPPPSPREEVLALESGAVARLSRDDAGERLAVHDAEGRLLLELRDGGRVAVLSVPAGDLELRAENGRVRLFGSEGVHLVGAELELEAERGRLRFGVLETHASRILERAEAVYRTVEGIHQLRAKDVRTIASQTIRQLAKRLRSKASADVKIDGEKIYLG